MGPALCGVDGVKQLSGYFNIKVSAPACGFSSTAVPVAVLLCLLCASTVLLYKHRTRSNTVMLSA